jgi:hypothetical protein
MRLKPNEQSVITDLQSIKIERLASYTRAMFASCLFESYGIGKNKEFSCLSLIKTSFI